METTTQNDGSPDPSLEAKDGETVGTDSERKSLKVAPGICGQCADHHYYGDELSDGKPYARGLMVEAMDAGHTVGSCAHFGFGAVAPVIDAEAQQLKALLAARDPKESLRQIRAVAKDIRQMLRNGADKTAMAVALNNIITLTGALP